MRGRPITPCCRPRPRDQLRGRVRRARILEALAAGPAGEAAIGRAVGLALNASSDCPTAVYHLEILERQGLVCQHGTTWALTPAKEHTA